MSSKSGVPEISKAKGVHGYNEADDRANPITITEDGTKNRLDVSAEVSGIADVNLDEDNDEVTVANTSDGGTTRALAKGDTDGRFQIDLERINGTATPLGGGTEAGALRVTVANDSTGVVSVDDNGGTLSIDDGGGSITVDGTFESVGNVAHDGVDSGNPVKVGYKAIAHGASPTAVAAADRTDAYANRHGIPFVVGGHPNIVTTEYMTTGAQANDDMLGAIGAGSKYVITHIMVTTDGTTTAIPQVRIGFGTASVPAEPASGASVTGVVASHPGLLGGTGFVKGDGSGILAAGGDGEELRITCDAPTGGQITVSVSHYVVPS